MKYRVRFQFNGYRGYYLTEWFDTYEEAATFHNRARDTDAVAYLRIEDEDEEEVL